ncbi:MAG: T9SS type A sorting domain-containing protein, partial [Candidatus Cloacimonetes bacterium]|nr:T9SS type A sorting domain-containing protein [Candidatus Cloacimonadota bacterium]
QSPALLRLKSYPNPFNPSTNITFDLPSAGKASLKVYNIKGQMVKLLADESFAKGSHTLSLELPAKPSGIYILALESNGKRITKRISLVK